MLSFVIFGMFAGAVGFALTLALGQSFWSALLVYSLVGAVSAALVPVVLFALDGRRNQRLKTMDAAEGAAADNRPLPVEDDATPSQSESNWRTIKILAVDDDPFIRELLPKIAAKVGCPDVTTAESGRAALELINASALPFDCVLVDISMPEMDGIDLCDRIRNLPAYHDTPIIMLTAMTDMNNLERAFRAGASDYTTKPFDIIDFGDRLRLAQTRIFARHADTATAFASRAKGQHADHGPGSARHPLRMSRLTGVPALIEPTALGNFVARLSGGALTRAYVMAVVIGPEADETLDHHPSAALQRLTLVASAIDDVMADQRYLMAQVGADHFILSASADRLPDALVLETALQARMERLWDALAAAERQRITLTTGMPVRLHSQRSDRARLAFETAVALARDRVARKHRAQQPPQTPALAKSI